MVAALRERFPEVRLLLVGAAKFVSGATRYDNVAYTAELEALVSELGLADAVVFTGERQDVPEVLRAIDVLLVPSWEEPFGRTVVEAMAMEVPVLATSEGGPAESLREGVDGHLLPPRDPAAWVEPAARLLSDPALRARDGAGRQGAGHRAVLERGAWRPAGRALPAGARPHLSGCSRSISSFRREQKVSWEKRWALRTASWGS